MDSRGSMLARTTLASLLLPGTPYFSSPSWPFASSTLPTQALWLQIRGCPSAPSHPLLLVLSLLFLAQARWTSCPPIWSRGRLRQRFPQSRPSKEKARVFQSASKLLETSSQTPSTLRCFTSLGDTTVTKKDTVFCLHGAHGLMGKSIWSEVKGELVRQRYQSK